MIIDNNYSISLSFFILGTSYLFWRYVQRQQSTAQKLQITYSKQTSWIWGHELEIFQHEASKMYIQWAESLGSVYRIKPGLFQPDIVVIGDNSAAHHILQNCYTYVKPPTLLHVVEKILGHGLAWAEGEDHKYQRRLLAPAFTSGAVEAMTDDIFSCVDRMTQTLRATLIDSDEKNGEIVDMVPIMSACTLDIIGRVGFGHDFDGGKSADAKAISDAWHQDVVMSRTFAGLIAPILISAFPWITSLPLPAFRDSVARQVVQKIAGKLISDNSNNTNVLRGRDILSILLNGTQNSKENLEARLTTTELLDNTTAVTVDFILLRLAQNPSSQGKLRDEIRSVAALDYNSISKLEYLNAVTKEGLRLHPASLPTERVVQPILTESGESVSSFAFKAGQVFRIPWTVLNVNKQVWGNNADEFIPERWIEPGGVPPADRLPHGPWSGVSSFSDGPRNCIGYRLGLVELKIMVAALVRSFEFECTEAKIVQYIAPSLQPFADGKAASMPLKVSLAPEM
ncbi:cytochrome P450 [Rhodocollybia butyracea]|uniref:Cytochrome P450 n=1 Tax=Rhodocollybia butyracea TaxID=206335 RepID=A0A9P5U4Y0_9AGAR|nr:cytochrome P450 [Rhodocollybia butyracea]